MPISNMNTGAMNGCTVSAGSGLCWWLSILILDEEAELTASDSNLSLMPSNVRVSDSNHNDGGLVGV